jgi:hypothetical protein
MKMEKKIEQEAEVCRREIERLNKLNEHTMENALSWLKIRDEEIQRLKELLHEESSESTNRFKRIIALQNEVIDYKEELKTIHNAALSEAIEKIDRLYSGDVPVSVIFEILEGLKIKP